MRATASRLEVDLMKVSVTRHDCVKSVYRFVNCDYIKANKTKTVELQALRAEHADALKEHESQLKKAHEKNEELGKQLKTANDENEGLEKRLKTANEKNEELEKQLEDATSETEKLRQEVTEVRDGRLDTQIHSTNRFLLVKISPEGCRQGQGCSPVRT